MDIKEENFSFYPFSQMKKWRLMHFVRQPLHVYPRSLVRSPYLPNVQMFLISLLPTSFPPLSLQGCACVCVCATVCFVLSEFMSLNTFTGPEKCNLLIFMILNLLIDRYWNSMPFELSVDIFPLFLCKFSLITLLLPRDLYCDRS